MMYTLADIQAIKSEIDAKKYAPGGVLGPKWTVSFSGEGFIPVGTISEDAWDKAAEPVPAVVKCHCGRDWHTAPLRMRVADMVRSHYFDPNYKAAEDTSPIVCVGSETLGPNRPEYHSITRGWDSNFNLLFSVDSAGFSAAMAKAQASIESMGKALEALTWPSWEIPKVSAPWVIWHDDEPQSCPDIPELDIKPELFPIATKQDKWVKLSTRERLRKALKAVPPNEWRESTPVPASLGLDVSALADEFNKKHNPPKYATKGINA